MMMSNDCRIDRVPKMYQQVNARISTDSSHAINESLNQNKYMFRFSFINVKYVSPSSQLLIHGQWRYDFSYLKARKPIWFMGLLTFWQLPPYVEHISDLWLMSQAV